MNSCSESKGPPTNHPTSSERDLQDVHGRETFLLGAKLTLKLVSSRQVLRFGTWRIDLNHGMNKNL